MLYEVITTLLKLRSLPLNLRGTFRGFLLRPGRLRAQCLQFTGHLLEFSARQLGRFLKLSDIGPELLFLRFVLGLRSRMAPARLLKLTP